MKIKGFRQCFKPKQLAVSLAVFACSSNIVSAADADVRLTLNQPVSNIVPVSSAVSVSNIVSVSSIVPVSNYKSNAVPLTNMMLSADVSVAEILTRSQYTIDDMCEKISNKLGSVRMSDCQGKGLDYAGGNSVNGLPIIMKEYPPIGKRVPLSRILVIGGIHGDEYSSVSIVFKWMKILNQFHSGLFHWKMVPVMNPDGLLRKKSQRMNERGVDLNRNFPTPNWRTESHKYWIHKTKRNPRRYPGPAPLSEPESQWLAEYIDEFKPDVIVSIHAPFGILDFDGPSAAPNQFGKLHLSLLGTYPGSLGNYAGKHQSLPVVTVELPYAGIMPTRSEIRNIWVDLVKWLRKNATESVREASQEPKKSSGKSQV